MGGGLARKGGGVFEGGVDALMHTMPPWDILGIYNKISNARWRI